MLDNNYHENFLCIIQTLIRRICLRLLRCPRNLRIKIFQNFVHFSGTLFPLSFQIDLFRVIFQIHGPLFIIFRLFIYSDISSDIQKLLCFFFLFSTDSVLIPVNKF